MKLFRCQFCDAIVYFENRTCGRCGHRLGYLPGPSTLAALEDTGQRLWSPIVKGAVAAAFLRQRRS